MSALLEVRKRQPHVSAPLCAVNDVSFDVQQGELLGLIGPNGAGKSTLFNLIAGVMPPTAGRSCSTGKPITGWKSYDMARARHRPHLPDSKAIPATFRHRERHAERVPAREDRSPARAGSRKPRWPMSGLPIIAGTPVEPLTVGLLKRLEVARALAMRPKLVLFDEIMAGLTPTEVGAMTKFVAGLPARGITVIWVEHVLYAIMKTATRMVVHQPRRADRRRRAGRRSRAIPRWSRPISARRWTLLEVKKPQRVLWRRCRCCTASTCRWTPARSSASSAPMPPAKAR